MKMKAKIRRKNARILAWEAIPQQRKVLGHFTKRPGSNKR
jgi:hypothetical protein